MRSFSNLLVLLVLAAACCAQYYPFARPGQFYFRDGSYAPAYPSFQHVGYDEVEQRAVSQQPEGRLFFTTLTLTLTTTTTTSTSTTTTTCTTSAATLTTCKAGRKRRGIAARGLFHNDEDEEESIFYSSEKVAEVQPEQTVVRESRQKPSPAVPYIVQPGFRAPEGAGSGRFLLAFGTSTVTATTTSTYTSSLTAVCSSTTSYSTCSSG